MCVHTGRSLLGASADVEQQKRLKRELMELKDTMGKFEDDIVTLLEEEREVNKALSVVQSCAACFVA